MSHRLMLELKEISKTFGKKTVLSNINYNFFTGNVYAIVGGSGNGKTTLLNILGLIDTNYVGQLILDGEILNPRVDYALHRAKKIGFVFQSYYLIEGLNVKENILLPIKYSAGEYDEDYFNKLVEKLSIKHLLDENVNYLSGGEKQRIAIARALINKPKLLICDEPTGNLDSINTNSVIEIINSFVSDDRTIIIVTHSMDVASCCTNIVKLENGTLYDESL